MANVRIKDLTTTAATTASDDFFGVDGATNGTRKLNAYSPTFGGNLTVSGTGTSSFGGLVTAADNFRTTNGAVQTGRGDNTLYIQTAGAVTSASFAPTASNIVGNLTVSGGTISSGTASLTLKSTSNTVVLQSAGTTALTLDASQNATFAGKITANGAGSTFKGTATNDSAAAGYMGEIITSTVESGSAVSLSNTVISDVTSISLTAGDWDVDGNVGYSTSGATVTQFLQGIATASGTAGPTGSYSKNPMSLSSDSNSWFQDAPTWRVSISSTTTIYLIARSYFSAGTVAAYGFLRARRVR